MKALRLHAIGDIQLHEEAVPSPAAGDELVKVTAVGICGSDLHWFAEGGIGDAGLKRPLVLGHEFAGVIASGERAGTRVAVDPAVNCGQCVYCHEGNPNFCLNLRFSGHEADDGALQEYLCWPKQAMFPIPDEISDADAAMLEPLGVAIHAVDLAHIKSGASVGVFGCGPIGLLIIQMARAAGATEIHATDLLPHRLQAAAAMGATAIYLADGSEGDRITRAARGLGVDAAFEAAGENAAIDAAVDASKRGGKVILAGIPADDRSAFTASTARRKGLTFRLVRRMKHTYPRAISLVQAGAVDVRSLVTHRFTLAQYQEAFDTAQRRDGLKVVIDLSHSQPGR